LRLFFTHHSQLPSLSLSRLSSLTDAQRAQLGQAAREESTRHQPLLAPQESLDALEQEYEKGGNDEFARKVKWLRECGGFVGEFGFARSLLIVFLCPARWARGG
jgi:hypothetical protein